MFHSLTCGYYACTLPFTISVCLWVCHICERHDQKHAQWHSQDDRLTRALYGHAPWGCKAERCVELIRPREEWKNFCLHFSLIRMGSHGTFMLCTASWGSVLLLPLAEFKTGSVLFFAVVEAQQSNSDSCLRSVQYDAMCHSYSCTCTPITALWP